VIPRSKSELEAGYPDLLDGADDPALLHVAQVLDAGYNLHRAPAAIRRLPSARPARHIWDALDTLGRPDPVEPVWPKRWRIHTKLYAAFTLVAACAILLATGTTNAGPNTSSIAYLGPPAPVLSTASERPLDGFHRVSTFVRLAGKPELIFLAAQVPARIIGIERWPLVKALSQFGRLTGIKAVDKQCVPIPKGPNAGQESCTIPTYDLTHARYSSPYLAFDSKDLVRTVGIRDRAFQPMSPIEKVLFDRYVRSRTKPVCLKVDKSGHIIRTASGQFITYTCTSLANYVDAALSSSQTTRTLPLIAVGDYLQTISDIMITGDFVETIPLTPTPGVKFPPLEDDRTASFDADRKAMLTGQAPFPLSDLVRNFNSEANIITALICHATKNQPKSVCNRPTIKQILKSVK